MNQAKHDPRQLAERIAKGERAALASAITLAESQLGADRELAQILLAEIWPHTGDAIRIGVTGAPGVGKSTFIDTFGQHVIAQGHRLAVLAVDPSSVRGGGSILGDKTRMVRLTGSESAFVRPSPSAGASGGVGLRTRESICLCEAAGFDVIIVETVGTGQAESAVADMTDLFILLLAPGGGDELQGVKRGVMELADFVVINKGDGELREVAQRTCGEYRAALRLMRPRSSDPEGIPTAFVISAIAEQGIVEAWQQVAALAQWRKDNGQLDVTRRHQLANWIRNEAYTEIMRRTGWSPENQLPRDIIDSVVRGESDPLTAARQLIS